MTTMNKEQLVEAIRDCIYEVLEEELDRKLQEAKKQKSQASLNEARDAKIKAIKEKIKAKKAAQLQEAKIAKMRALVKAYDSKKQSASKK